MTQLLAHLTTTGETQSALAKRLGISRSHMNELAAGIKGPSLELAFAIERATMGAVPASSWVVGEGATT